MAGAERNPSFLKRTVARGIEAGAEISKKVDTVMIAIGAGIYAIGSATLGFAIIIGSVLTMIPANEAQKWARKNKG